MVNARNTWIAIELQPMTGNAFLRRCMFARV